MILSEIKGLGPKAEKYLNELGIYSAEDLINYYPYRYEILKKTSLDDERIVISGIIESNPTVNYFNKKNSTNQVAKVLKVNC